MPGGTCISAAPRCANTPDDSASTWTATAETRGTLVLGRGESLGGACLSLASNQWLVGKRKILHNRHRERALWSPGQAGAKPEVPFCRRAGFEVAVDQ